jgi:hypothetical protein
MQKIMVVGALLTSGSSLASVLVMVASTYRLRESADSVRLSDAARFNDR